MAAMGVVVAITAGGVLLSAGIWLEQGWLAIVGMLAMASVVVGGFIKASDRSYQPPPPAYRRRQALKPDSVAMVGVLGVSAAAVVLMFGIWQGLGFVSVAGMLLVAATMIGGLVKASSR